MKRTIAAALITSLVGCQKTQPPAQEPRAPAAATPDVVAPAVVAAPDAAAPSQRSADAPDRSAIPEGSGWSCAVSDADGGMRDDTCRRTASACEDMSTRANMTMAENRRLARQLGLGARFGPMSPLRCIPSAQAHCITYVDAQDSQVHWDCSRTAERCAGRRTYFREENQRGESVVRYRSISECEAFN